MSDLTQHVTHIIQQHQLIPPGTTIVLGVSGGADSICLMHILAQLQVTYDFTLHIATLNHGLRVDAASDVEYVKQLAQHYNLYLSEGFKDVASLAQTYQESVEMAARRARYDFFAEVAQSIGSSVVATAHHSDDQSETIVLHLLRGTGTKGLVGMEYKSQMPNHSELVLIRPMLGISRADIEAFCDEHGLSPRIDKSNYDTIYLRNAIRHEILPQLRNINPQFDTALQRLADIVTVEQDYLNEMYQVICVPHIQFGTPTHIALKQFQKWHKALQRYSLRQIAEYLQLELRYQHIEDVIAQGVKGDVGAQVSLPNNHRLRVGYEFLYIERVNAPVLLQENHLLIDQEFALNLEKPTVVGDWSIIASIMQQENFHAMLSIPEDATLSLRTRRAGDRWQPFGLNGKTQKLKKWLIDHKIPQPIRDYLPLLCVNNDIAAIIFEEDWKISNKYAVKHNSKSILYFYIHRV